MAATAAFSHLTTASLFFPPPQHHHPSSLTSSLILPNRFLTITTPLKLISSIHTPAPPSPFLTFSNGGVGGGGDSGGAWGGGGGGGDDGDAGERNKAEALMALAEVGRSMDSIPKDLAAAIEAGRIPGSIVYRYFELEKSAVFRWLLSFGGFKERLLADDLFLTKVAIECGVGIFTKTAAELEKRRENFTKELDFVCADVQIVEHILSGFQLQKRRFNG